VTVLDSDPDHVEVLRRLGMRVFYGDASRPDLLRAAGAEHARVLVVALRDPDEVVALTHAVQRHFPRLEIVARAANRSAATRLLNGGVERVHRDTLDSALRAGTDVMSLLGTPRFQAVRAAQAFRHHDERHLRRLAAVAHDRVRYISEARESIRLIEETMLAEVAEGPERDSGWDNTSLRRDTAERGTPTAEDGADGETDRPAPPLPEDPSPTVA
jgi:monovalent cation:H+ antiporter-2, CPA2 family